MAATAAGCSHDPGPLPAAAQAVTRQPADAATQPWPGPPPEEGVSNGGRGKAPSALLKADSIAHSGNAIVTAAGAARGEGEHLCEGLCRDAVSLVCRGS